MIIFTILLSLFLIINDAQAALIDNSFVNQCYGAKIAAMGECGTALYGNPEYAYFNPASNGFISNAKINSSYSDYYAGSFLQGSFSVALPISGWGVVSAVVPIQVVSNIPLTQKDIGNNEFYQIGSYNDIGAAGLLSWANVIDNSISFGATLRYTKQKIYNQSSAGFGYDIGALYKVDSSYANFLVGLSILDIGNTVFTWDTGYSDYIQMSTRLGVAIEKRIDDCLLRVACDAVSQGSQSEIRYGVDFQISNLSFMAGLKNDTLTYGMGLRMSDMEIDYGIKTDKNLGNISKVSVGLSF
ncbi:MAG: hypothetical protein DKM50_11350 [Candidatus Margulisiibacteriota bacterium]|nr:MAG: hypothetical protein A2X43_12160 [Candidatus Margulisbacteria bacterium GWD2_39_127]OGI03210.1 MAG: hypothetical protein A2X42_11400 [Candidatus Margulisbacteria bacterium GWF2_38_17]OGI11234.1 MAG: hypothetical protein A2X41_03825 [Candidatus Margulisbacteria bacterium GWE2_39_32]PZM78551.1 MAG: hypothetical protein DKM50_11350 [Candidatus Margulisiibacteriota bacterium]HAR63882.1 hypothetical protein [Candidatus Margulisiibacteriota bacterium]